MSESTAAGAPISESQLLARVRDDMLLEPGGLLDELRAKGYEVDAP